VHRGEGEGGDDDESRAAKVLPSGRGNRSGTDPPWRTYEVFLVSAERTGGMSDRA